MERIAASLFIFGLLDLVCDIAVIVSAFKSGGSFQLSFPFGFLAYWIAGFFALRNQRQIWPILTYFSALSLGLLAGSALGGLLGLPFRLLLALAHEGSLLPWAASVRYLLYFPFLGWLLFAAHSIWAPREATVSRWLRPKACLLYLFLPALLLSWGLLTYMRGSWTEPIIERARKAYGARYDYQLSGYHFESTNGHTRCSATVLAYDDKEVRQLTFNWSN